MVPKRQGYPFRCCLIKCLWLRLHLFFLICYFLFGLKAFNFVLYLFLIFDVRLFKHAADALNNLNLVRQGWGLYELSLAVGHQWLCPLAELAGFSCKQKSFTSQGSPQVHLCNLGNNGVIPNWPCQCQCWSHGNLFGCCDQMIQQYFLSQCLLHRFPQSSDKFQIHQ